MSDIPIIDTDIETITTALQPVRDQIVIETVEDQHLSPGGIALPQVISGATNEAVVIAVGPGTVASDGSRVPMQVQVGDTVIFLGQSLELIVDGRRFESIPEAAVVAIVVRS